MKIKETIKAFYNSLSFSGTSKWIFYGILVGVVTGVMGLLYYKALEGAGWFVSWALGLHLPKAGGEGGDGGIIVAYRWVLLFLPGLGGLAVGLMHRFYTRNTLDATDGYINFFHKRRAIMDARKPLYRLLSSVITISTGGSAGKEGPVIFAGAGLASFLARVFKLPDRDRAILTVCGAGGGLGAIFRAPIGGALYAAEVLYRQGDFEAEAVMPGIITSVTAYAVFALFGNWLPVFSTPHYSFAIRDLPFFALLGIIAPAFAFGYAKALRYTERLFRFLRIPSWLKPGIGGLAVGVILFFLPHVAGPGYGMIQLALDAKLVLWMMLVIAVAKIVATSMTISSGGSGGLFAPALVIGGMVGGAFGLGLNALGVQVQPEAFVMVGMGAFLTSAANVPLASIIIISEMAGNYELLVPMTLAASVAFLISRRFSIYPTQVDSRWQSPAHRGEFAVDILEDMRVSEAMAPGGELPCFKASVSMETALHQIADNQHECFPVVDEEGKMIGVLFTDDIRSALYHGELEAVEDILVVEDVMRTKVPVLSPEDDLHKALVHLDRSEMDELPVVKDGKCVGLLTRRGLLKAYEGELLRRKKHMNGNAI